MASTHTLKRTGNAFKKRSSLGLILNIRLDKDRRAVEGITVGEIIPDTPAAEYNVLNSGAFKAGQVVTKINDVELSTAPSKAAIDKALKAKTVTFSVLPVMELASSTSETMPTIAETTTTRRIEAGADAGLAPTALGSHPPQPPPVDATTALPEPRRRPNPHARPHTVRSAAPPQQQEQRRRHPPREREEFAVRSADPSTWTQAPSHMTEAAIEAADLRLENDSLNDELSGLRSKMQGFEHEMHGLRREYEAQQRYVADLEQALKTQTEAQHGLEELLWLRAEKQDLQEEVYKLRDEVNRLEESGDEDVMTRLRIAEKSQAAQADVIHQQRETMKRMQEKLDFKGHAPLEFAPRSTGAAPSSHIDDVLSEIQMLRRQAAEARMTQLEEQQAVEMASMEHLKYQEKTLQDLRALREMAALGGRLAPAWRPQPLK